MKSGPLGGEGEEVDQVLACFCACRLEATKVWSRYQGVIDRKGGAKAVGTRLGGL